MLFKEYVFRDEKGRKIKNTIGLEKFPSVELNENFNKEIDRYFKNRTRNFCLETSKLSVVISFEAMIKNKNTDY